jgi:hypothetical protein
VSENVGSGSFSQEKATKLGLTPEILHQGRKNNAFYAKDLIDGMFLNICGDVVV